VHLCLFMVDDVDNDNLKAATWQILM